MSYQAQAWVNENAPYGAGVKRAVLKELANYADLENATAWPGLERLALDAGYSRRAVWGALHDMQQEGVIALDRGGRGRGLRSVWRVVMDVSKWTLSAESIASGAKRAARRRAMEERAKRGLAVAPYRRRKKVQPLHLIGGGKVQPETEKGAIGAQKGATGDTKGRSHLSYDPSRTISDPPGGRTVDKSTGEGKEGKRRCTHGGCPATGCLYTAERSELTELVVASAASMAMDKRGDGR